MIILEYSLRLFCNKLLYNIIGKLQLEERKLNIGIDIDGVLTDMEREVTDYATKMCVEEGLPIEVDVSKYYETDSFNWTQEQSDRFWNKYLSRLWINRNFTGCCN